MQPFNHGQQIPFRYFDSDTARKRPLVVSFRRIQKMTPNNLENSNSVSICDIHRIDTKLRDCNDVMTMKIMPKYGSNLIQRSTHCNGSQSCRNFSSNSRQKSRMDSLFVENNNDSGHSEKGCVFPKEKFYGNSKLMLTMNDEILRKAVIDCEEDSFAQRVDVCNRSQRRIASHRLTWTRNKNGPLFKSDRNKRLRTIGSATDDSRMIDELAQYYKGNIRKNDFVLRKRYSEKITVNDEALDKALNKDLLEYETTLRAFGKISKSSSTPSVFPSTKLSSCVKAKQDRIIIANGRSVSLLNVKQKPEDSLSNSP